MKEYTQFMLDRLGQEKFLSLALQAGTVVKRPDAVAEWKEKYKAL